MTTFTIYWIAADGQRSIECGSFASRAEAEANIAAALDWLLEVGSADDEPAIKAGSMSIDEEGTDDDDAE